MNLSSKILKLIGWKVIVSTPDYPKSIICVAPHTSNWDFFICELAIHSVGRRSGFLMKEFWFFFPLGILLKKVGGIPVPRKRGGALVDTIVKKFNSTDHMVLAVTPEGTRSRTTKWRTGFLRIAIGANVPLQLAYLDFAKKEIGMTETFTPTGDIEADLEKIKQYYKNFTGKHPEKFAL